MYPAVEGAQHPQVYPSRFEDREPLESRNERTRWRGGPEGEVEGVEGVEEATEEGEKERKRGVC